MTNEVFTITYRDWRDGAGGKLKKGTFRALNDEHAMQIVIRNFCSYGSEILFMSLERCTEPNAWITLFLN